MHQGSHRSFSGTPWNMDGIESSIRSGAANVAETPAATGYDPLDHLQHDLAGVGTAFERFPVQRESSITNQHLPNRHRRKVPVRSGTEKEKFPCPYRLRDPARFNVREHHNCANNAYKDMATLKRHIRTCHRQLQLPHTCVRCHKGFRSSDELLEHMRAPPDQICRVVERQSLIDPEDGITDEVDTLLAERKNDTKVSSWKELWQILFPSDEEIPPPVVEISEVARAVQGINFEEMWLSQGTTGASSNLQDEPPYLPSSQFVPHFITNLTAELESISTPSYATDQFVGFDPNQLQFDPTPNPQAWALDGLSLNYTVDNNLDIPSPHSNIETDHAQKRTKFSCDKCDKTFNKRPDNLKRHMRVAHHMDTFYKYTCHCAYESTRKDNFRRHIATCKRKRVIDSHCKCGYKNSNLKELEEHTKECKFGHGITGCSQTGPSASDAISGPAEDGQQK
ncbi:hypothetical protein GGS26DRAFT_81606 [Hypomontagnella submonticulosa]|nr:hypothetical protein GGS26DRAFT_81606 [Hypomontagnella submonticulosa]